MTTAHLIVSFLLAGGLLLGLAGCGPEGSSSMQYEKKAEPAKTPAKYVHAVFFACKPETPESEIDSLIADGCDLLGKIPSVRTLRTGRRDEQMTRDVNVTDYTVGLLVIFDDKKGLDEYSDHPLHQQYVEKHKAHWDKVRVFDFIAK